MITIYWEDWTSTKEQAYLELIIQPLCGIIIIILFIIFIHVFICKKKLCCCEDPNYDIKHANGIIYNSVIKFYVKLVFVSFIMSILNIFGNLWVSNIELFLFNVRDSNGCFYRTAFNASMLIQRIIAYYFFISRLRNTFEGSIFEMSKIVYYIYISIIGIVSFGQYGVITVLTYFYGDVRCAVSDVITQAIIVLLITDNLIHLSITALFVIKLRGLNKMLNYDVTDNAKQILRIVTTKLTILCINTVIFTVIFSVIIGNVLTIFTYQCYAIDLIINNICMMLSFVILDYQFNKICYCCICISSQCIRHDPMSTALKLDSSTDRIYTM